MTDLGRLLAVLVDAGVDMIIVGGAAATAHGAARLTQDLDVVYARSRENLARLAGALAHIARTCGAHRQGCHSSWMRERWRTG